MKANNEFPCVSIIILNFNGKRYLDACFSSLSSMLYPKERLEVIMVDNCSNDDSVIHVKAKFPWVRVIALNSNYGFTRGNNIGVKLSKGEYVVLLNNDVVVSENWLLELIKIIRHYPDAIVTSKAFFLNDRKVINHDGAKATFIGRGFCTNCGKISLPDSNSANRFVIQPYGASMILKKSVYDQLGGFDENYWTSIEDLDIGLRAWLYGYKVIYAPRSIFYHVAGGTAGKGSKVTDTMMFHTAKNSYLNILKNFDIFHIFIGVFLSFIYYADVISLYTIKTKKFNTPVIIIRAHIWVIKNFGKIMRQRKIIAKNRKISYTYLFNRQFFAYPSEMLQTHLELRTLLERLK